jgi:adenylate cyclase
MVRRHLPFLGGVGSTLVLALVFVLLSLGVVRWPLLQRMEAWSLDARFRLRGPRKPKDARIVIIGVDDKVRAEIPKLNQERRVWARFIDRVAAAHPRAIGIDYIFDTPEEVLPTGMVKRLRVARGDLTRIAKRDDLAAEARVVITAVRTLTEALLEHSRGDERMGAAFGRAGNVVPAVLFHFKGTGHEVRTGRIGRAAYAETVLPKGLSKRRLPPRALGVSGITPSLERHIAAAGFVNNIVEDDGATRRYYTAIRYGDQVYVPLSLQLARMAQGVSRSDLAFVAGRTTVDTGGGKGGSPLDSRGRLLIDFLGPRGTFKTISAADVMAGRVDPSVLRDKIVLIGPNDSANVDKAITPFDPLLPGVELHATVIHNVLHGEGLVQVSWLWNLLVVLLLGLSAALLHTRRLRRRFLWISVGTVGLFVAYLICVQLLFASGRWISVIFPVGGLLSVTLVTLVLGFLTEGLEKRRIRHLFSQYLHADVIRELTDDPGALKLGGERREVTVLFSDIRGFSTIAEQLDPQELALLINQYLTPMTDAVLDEQGYLDKYIGDAIMAIFGAPRVREDHPELSARTAVTMLGRLERLNRMWKDRDWAPMRIGIGMNLGEVSLGNFGSERRFEYTAIGDTVNLASRLEGLNKVYRTAILVAEPLARRIEDTWWLREIDLVRVKGKEIATRIFELLGSRDEDCPVDTETFATARQAYVQARWDDARQGFKKVLAADPGDGPSQVFLERIDALEAEGITADSWDGVFVMDTK